MRAARFHGAGDIRVEDVPVPEAKAGEVLIEVEWCGICGTDLHEYLIGPLVVNRKEKPHTITGAHVPVILGHEFCGRIVKTAEGSDLKLGQAVMVDPRINCKSCHSCASGIDNLCGEWGFLGLNGNSGGFSEYAAVEPKMCYPLPDDVNMDEASLIEPLCVGRHALAVTSIKDYSKLSVLVLGGGPIGLSVIWNLRAVGVDKIIVSEPSKLRQEHTRDLADHVLDPITDNIGEGCRFLTSGLGVDVVFDCAGVPAGLEAGMDAARTRATYVNVAGWEKPFVMPMAPAMFKEMTIKFSIAYDHEDFEQVTKDFVAGKFEGVGKMITSRILVEDLAEKGFEELIHKKDLHVKIVATPKKTLLDEASSRGSSNITT
ncbi:related to threonine dehydrogenase and related Zn-dependent dehydrogenases [Ramularia collo-cygni]|uniref:Related to threonine dehydrogenase and related Zn-dependent dehydrogenases n=1 Tax=Ramularia collo-cygni TaxID=112498 RepID=A0A2D3UZY9_9PEZI|nr:related to threonine dehydrogenase and related Zn-dependent dehydrogenases [Ramularia collo-cygni]CZT17987.1 related to threonine dehydrogenase and related Zn-dependent dehydrogenases [Ramularia collo-cygni]